MIEEKDMVLVDRKKLMEILKEIGEIIKETKYILANKIKKDSRYVQA